MDKLNITVTINNTNDYNVDASSLIPNYVLANIKTVFAIINHLQNIKYDKKQYLPCGFYETYDIIFYFNNYFNNNKNNIIYSLYNDLFYPDINDLDYLKAIKKYELLPSSYDNLLNELNKLNNPNIPEKWLKILNDFYKQFTNNKENLDLVIDYVLLITRTLLIQAPTIMNRKFNDNDYLFIGYRYPKIHQIKKSLSYLQVKIITLENDPDFETREDSDKLFSFLLKNIETSEYYTKVPYDFYKALGLEKKEMQFDFIFIVPKPFTGYIMPLMFKSILESTLRFPLLINSIELLDNNKETEKEYKKIVNEELENIIFYLVRYYNNNDLIHKSLILNYIKDTTKIENITYNTI